MKSAVASPRRIAALLTLAVLLAYGTVLRRGGFIWDDDVQIVDNVHLRSPDGLARLWTHVGPARGGTPQYYPLTFSVFWLEHRLWGLRPFGYHLVNVLLHAFNAFLFWKAMRTLRAPGALLAAALFAVHPVHVESVAWAIELKNVLSGMFFLLSALCGLRYLGFTEADDEPPAGQGLLFAANALFICALASKTSTVALPGVILVLAWWKTGRVGRRAAALTAPMLLAAAGAGLLTFWVEKYQVGAAGSEWGLTAVERALLAGRLLWFYAGKLVWPAGLSLIYPRWIIRQDSWAQCLFPLAAAAALGGLWLGRARFGRGPLAAALIFAGCLVPVLGFFDVYFMRYSYAADHFQYLASMGLIAAFAAGAARLQERPGARTAVRLAAAAMLLVFTGLSARRGAAYESLERMWNETLRTNPSAWLAHNNLGVILAARGEADLAIAHYREVLRLKSDYAEAENNWGLALAGSGRASESLAHYREALRLRPGFADAHHNLGAALASLGRTADAITELTAALSSDPSLASAYSNLCAVLSGQGRTAEAIARCREALRLAPDFPEAHLNLGLVLVRTKDMPEAIAHFREALRLRPGYPDAARSLELALRGRTPSGARAQ